MSFDISELAGIASKTRGIDRKALVDRLGPSSALKEALKAIDQQNQWLKASSHLRTIEDLRETWEKMDPMAQYRKWLPQEDWRHSAMGTVSRLYETLQKQYSGTSYAELLHAASKRDLDSFESLRKTALATHLESLAAERNATWIANSAIEKAMEQVKAVNLHINEALHGSAIERSLRTALCPTPEDRPARHARCRHF